MRHMEFSQNGFQVWQTRVTATMALTVGRVWWHFLFINFWNGCFWSRTVKHRIQQTLHSGLYYTMVSLIATQVSTQQGRPCVTEWKWRKSARALSDVLSVKACSTSMRKVPISNYFLPSTTAFQQSGVRYCYSPFTTLTLQQALPLKISSEIPEDTLDKLHFFLVGWSDICNGRNW